MTHREERIESARDMLAAYLLRRDTQILEWLMAWAALLNGWTASIIQPDGRPLAPFLSSALKLLSFDKPWWIAALASSGVLTLVCLLISARRSFFLPRAIVAGVQCLIYTAIVAAILTADPPSTLAAAGRYALSAHAMFLVTLILSLKYLKERQAHLGEKTDAC